MRRSGSCGAPQHAAVAAAAGVAAAPDVAQAQRDHQVGLLLDQVLMDVAVEGVPAAGARRCSQPSDSLFNRCSCGDGPQQQRRVATHVLKPSAGLRLEMLSSALVEPAKRLASSAKTHRSRAMAAKDAQRALDAQFETARLASPPRWRLCKERVGAALVHAQLCWRGRDGGEASSNHPAPWFDQQHSAEQQHLAAAR